MESDSRPVRTVEVCIGPDCSVSGGPAALMEIEELAMESTCQFHVHAGGCRNLCAMGPNVHCEGSHFGKVNSPDDCEQIAKAVGIWPTRTDDNTTGSRVGIMLTNRAKRSRWKFLRSISRQSNCTSANKAALRKVLKEAYDAEVAAAASFANAEAMRQRADRRFERFKGMIDEL